MHTVASGWIFINTKNGTVGNRMGGYGLDSSGLGWGLLAGCEHRSEEIGGLTK